MVALVRVSDSASPHHQQPGSRMRLHTPLKESMMDPQACRSGLNNVCIYVGGPNRTPNLKYAGDKIILKLVLAFRASRSELQRFAAGLRWVLSLIHI